MAVLETLSTKFLGIQPAVSVNNKDVIILFLSNE